MTITELREKYQKELKTATDAFEAAAGSNMLAPLWPRMDAKIILLRKFISDLDTVIQSEEKERRELLERYYMYLQRKGCRVPNGVFHIDRFLESEKGGEG